MKHKAHKTPPVILTSDEQRVFIDCMRSTYRAPMIFMINTGAIFSDCSNLEWAWHEPCAGDCCLFNIPPRGNQEQPRQLFVNAYARTVAGYWADMPGRFVFGRNSTPLSRPGHQKATGWNQARGAIKWPNMTLKDLRYTYLQRVRDVGATDDEYKSLAHGRLIRGVKREQLYEIVNRLIDLQPIHSEEFLLP